MFIKITDNSGFFAKGFNEVQADRTEVEFFNTVVPKMAAFEQEKGVEPEFGPCLPM